MVMSLSMKLCFNRQQITAVTPDLALWEMPLESVKLMGLGLNLQTVKVNKNQLLLLCSYVVKVELRSYFIFIQLTVEILPLLPMVES